MRSITDEEVRLVELISNKLTEQHKKIASAESCTGGLLAWLLTHLAGSSDYYVGGVSAYSNAVKANILGVDKEILEKHGAVSKQVAFDMAEKARKLFHSDFAVSLTGIAGPGGGTPEKPVGTVWCGVSSASKTEVYLLQLSGGREEIRHNAAVLALEKINSMI